MFWVGLECAACFSCLCVESYEEFVCEGDADDFGRLAGGGEAFAEGDEVWFVAATNAGDDEEEIADGGASSSDGAFALMFAAVLGQGREASELGDGLVG